MLLYKPNAVLLVIRSHSHFFYQWCYTSNVYRDLRGLCREIQVQGFQKGLHPSIRNRAVCSKRPFLLGTLAQLSRTVRWAARTPGTHCAAVQASIPITNGRLERTGPIDLLWVQVRFEKKSGFCTLYSFCLLYIFECLISLCTPNP